MNRLVVIGIVVVTVIGLLFGAYRLAYNAGRDDARAECELAMTQQKAAAEEAARLAVEDAMKEGNRRVKEQADLAAKAQERARLADADRDNANAASIRLRRQIAETVADAHRVANADNPAAAAKRSPAGSPVSLLADVLVRADTRAGELAAYADKARIAGQLCTESYDALTIKQQGRGG